MPPIRTLSLISVSLLYDRQLLFVEWVLLAASVPCVTRNTSLNNPTFLLRELKGWPLPSAPEPSSSIRTRSNYTPHAQRSSFCLLPGRNPSRIPDPGFPG